MNRLPVDLSELAALFDQARRGPVRAFLDRQSGELEWMPRHAEVEGVFDDIVAAPERWVEIQPLPARQRLELRRRFVDQQVSDPYLRLRLFEVLEGEGGNRTFTRFEALLREGSELLDQWFSFRSQALELLARTWLSALHIEPRA